MAIKPKFPAKAPGTVQPPRQASHDVYVQGDAIPVPEAIEKDSDSVWALWSDAINGAPDKGAETEPATLLMGLQELPTARARKGHGDKDAETQPATLLMGLHELPKEPGA